MAQKDEVSHSRFLWDGGKTKPCLTLCSVYSRLPPGHRGLYSPEQRQQVHPLVGGDFPATMGSSSCWVPPAGYPCMEEPGGLRSIGLRKSDMAAGARTHTHTTLPLTYCAPASLASSLFVFFTGTLLPSAQRLVWAAKQALGKAALGALFAGAFGMWPHPRGSSRISS